MIKFCQGDILKAEVDAQINTVNCVGVMGRGIALQFKNAYPENFKVYALACKRGDVQPGRMLVFDTGRLTPPRYIINFPTKRHWRGRSRIEDIQDGLLALVREIRQRRIRSVAIPPLGSGLGGLDWAEVRPLVVQAMQPLSEVDVWVFEPGEVGADQRRNATTAVPKMTAGRAALVGLMTAYLQPLLDPYITLLEVHKLMYFLQVAGEPLQLRYVKGPYGPYAENLRHVLRAIEGHFIQGYADGGEAPDKELAVVPGVERDAQAFLATQESTLQRFERVTRLVEGFETSFGLELLATVHWVADNEQAGDLSTIERRVYAWNERKRQFAPAHIACASERLISEGWLTSISREGPVEGA